MNSMRVRNSTGGCCGGRPRPSGRASRPSRPIGSAAIGAAVLLAASVAPAVCGGDEPPLLEDGVPTPAVLKIADDEIVSFRVEVPKDAVLLTATVAQGPLILDVLARKDRPLASADDAEHRSNADVLDNALRISRQSSPALEEGTYYIGVTYLGPLPAVVHKRPVKTIPFTITCSFVRAKPPVALEPGKRTKSQVRAEEGSVRTFAVDVPAEAKALRIDLDDVSSDLDILARYGEPAVRNEDAGDTAISPLGRETLIIRPTSPQPLKAGRWYVNVVHPSDIETVDFAIYASFSADPPPPLLPLPELPMPTDSRKRAIHATVDLSTEYGGASGTLLTPEGLVLTNYHVVAEVAEAAEDAGEKDPVVVAATIHPQEPARELFRGRVLKFDKSLDLALIQITCGLYHQPLPRNFRFPWIPMADSSALEIGERVSIVGFPSIGGTVGRVSVTFTQGVVSGFEKTSIGTLIKTDANIGPGSSGGAAIDVRGRLIGVPTSENIRPEVVGRMSYVHPVALLPGPWRDLIRQGQQAAETK